MKYTVLLSFLVTSCLYGQEVIYFSKEWKRTSPDSAKYFRKAEPKDQGFVVEYFYIKGGKYSSGYYSSLGPDVREGEFTYYDSIGGIQEIKHFKNNKLHGSATLFNKNNRPSIVWNYAEGLMQDTSKSYYPEGQLKRYEVWDKGTFVGGKVYTKSGADTTFYKYEELASYPGGNEALAEFIRNNVHYPKKARKDNVQGKVLIKFVIDTEGAVSDITVVKSVHPLLDEAAIAVVSSMPAWIPARMDGRPVRCYFHLPIGFKLTD